jgi:SAM-dependent methyltransferase
MPDKLPDAVSAHYLGEQGQVYECLVHPDINDPRYEYDFSYFKPFIRKTDSVLDFGCSNGGILKYARLAAGKAEGLEVNEYAANLARGLGFTVYPDLVSLPSGPEFDVIYSNHVLEHVRDVAMTLERLRVSLKQGGLILLKLPMDDWRAPDQKTWSREDINHHLYAWTPLSIGNLLMETGYQVEKIRIVTRTHHPKLEIFMKLNLHHLAFWALAVYRSRRQLFAVAKNA